ncbi:hypothetical protein [Wolbachia endosymbiont (group A) of Volucella inflata]|nr:hypothetical protein [Wolbachia endosymbiont (group A) of Volucella inflata]
MASLKFCPQSLGFLLPKIHFSIEQEYKIINKSCNKTRFKKFKKT